MICMPSSRDVDARPPFKLGDGVRTPSGAFATIVAIYHLRTDAEADVVYADGQEVRFRLSVLKPLPGQA